MVRKVLCLVLALVMLFSVMALSSSCSKKDKEPTATTTKSAGTGGGGDQEPATTERTEMATIEWFTDIWGAPPEDSTKTLVGQVWLNELNIRVLGDNDSDSASGEKLQIRIATGDLPDVVSIINQTTWSKLVTDGLIEPLDDHFPRLTNLREMVPEEMDWMLVSPDGKTYGLPLIFATKNINGRACLMIHRDYYEQMGSPDISTYQKFEDVLRSSVGRFKDKNGKDVVPLYSEHITPEGTFWFNIFAGYGVKLGPPGLYSYDEEDGPRLITKSPAFRDAMLMVNRWYNDGLLDQEVFISNTEVNLAKQNAESYVFRLDDFWEIENYPGTPYWAWTLPPVDESFTGKYYNYPYAPAPVGFTGITTECKDKDAALDWLNWCMSDRGQWITWFGLEPNTLKGIPGYEDLLEAVRQEDGTIKIKEQTEEQKAADAELEIPLMAFWTNPFLAQDIQWQSFWPSDIDQIRSMTLEWVWDSAALTKVYADPDTEELRIEQKVKDLLANYYPRIIMAEGEAEANNMIDALISELNRADAEKLEALWQAKWKANLERMGK